MADEANAKRERARTMSTVALVGSLALAALFIALSVRAYLREKRDYVLAETPHHLLQIVPGPADRVTVEGRHIFAEVAADPVRGSPNYRFILRVQAVHPLLFMLSGWLASLVFSFFTYTMVVSFGNVGKAIGVLMLIVQISGANAAYPVQMLPDFIAKVSPLLPLTHAVTMMRAAIAGIYDMDYWRAAGMLLAFVPPLLLLGLLLRKPLVRFNQWYVAQVESTKVLS